MEATEISRKEDVTQFASTCLPDLSHTRQVTKSALMLFDALKSLHKDGEEERCQLEYAALLHDIGWVQGWKSHHKNALKMILENQKLPFSNKEKLIIGSIARYHRKSLPDVSHDHYAALSPSERKVVSRMAAILRIADGLDYAHGDHVQSISCIIQSAEVIIQCQVRHYSVEEEKQAYKKADLFEKVFHRRVYIRFNEV